MSTLKAAELKKKLKDRNLPTTGTKAELVKRLLEAGVQPEELCIGKHVSDEELQSDEPQPGTSAQEIAPTLQEVELLRRERDLAAREAALLRREIELLRMSPQPEGNLTRPSVKKWQELKDLVGEFSGSNADFERWDKQVKKLLSTYNLDDHRAKALVCSRLAGKALKWYHSRIDCVDLTCEALLQELKKMYGQRPDRLLLRREFEARVWTTSETFADYLHDKVTLANRVPISDLEIISYIVEGIPNPGLRTQAKVQGYESIDAMLTAFATVQLPKGTSHQSVKQPQGSPSSTGKQKEKPKSTQGNDLRRCYNCNETGHMAAAVRSPNGSAGHVLSAESLATARVPAVLQQRMSTAWSRSRKRTMTSGE
ncbi:hypothetical protein X777_15524 [Ooceraea biroi]|uniref:SAP domain-containing protein n=1 Tax=Ooceraea biroi TaxID=2015173 RepID=A0A026X3S5_OOCBI|nr:hypothetical protein X777_15524 [Ooceraea biroi]